MKTQPAKKSAKRTVNRSTKRPARQIEFDVPAPDDFGPRRRHIDLETVDEELHAAVQAKLISLATKPVTPRSLLELEQMTRLMRQFIAIGVDPMAMKVPHAHVAGGGALYQPYQQTAFPAEYDGVSGGVSIAPAPAPYYGGSSALAPSPPVENFGATIVRELMSLLGAKKPEGLPVPVPASEMDKLIDAIALAREKGLKDVEKTLMKQLVKLSMEKQGSKPSGPSEPPDWPPSYAPKPPNGSA